MNFDEAVTAHTDWKMKLRKYISKPDQSLNPAVVGQDNQCALGKWIYGEGLVHKALPEYENLRKLHGSFHQCAAKVLVEADKGNATSAEAMIASGSEYLTVSNSTVGAILTLKKKINT